MDASGGGAAEGGADNDPGVDLGNGAKRPTGEGGSDAGNGNDSSSNVGDDDYEGSIEVKSGCACRTPAGARSASGAWFGIGLMALLAARRRRQR
jgi:MYXO-CTERM domain-containing protein